MGLARGTVQGSDNNVQTSKLHACELPNNVLEPSLLSHPAQSRATQHMKASNVRALLTPLQATS